MTGIDALAAINFIRTRDAFLPASPADLLEFWRNDKLTIDASVNTLGAWKSISILNERTVAMSGLEASFTAPAPWIFFSELISY
jgi:hypothetical protein